MFFAHSPKVADVFRPPLPLSVVFVSPVFGAICCCRRWVAVLTVRLAERARACSDNAGAVRRERPRADFLFRWPCLALNGFLRFGWHHVLPLHPVRCLIPLLPALSMMSCLPTKSRLSWQETFNALVLVVNLADVDGMEPLKMSMERMLAEESLKGIPLLVVAHVEATLASRGAFGHRLHRFTLRSACHRLSRWTDESATASPLIRRSCPCLHSWVLPLGRSRPRSGAGDLGDLEGTSIARSCPFGLHGPAQQCCRALRATQDHPNSLTAAELVDILGLNSIWEPSAPPPIQLSCSASAHDTVRYLGMFCWVSSNGSSIGDCDSVGVRPAARAPARRLMKTTPLHVELLVRKELWEHMRLLKHRARLLWQESPLLPLSPLPPPLL